MDTGSIVTNTPTLVNGQPLKMVAKRYSPFFKPRQGGITLLFLHGIGTHKEHWEPIIESLFHHQDEKTAVVNEAWAIDWPNHGDSAIMNREALRELKPESDAVILDIAAAIVEFVREHLANRRLICVGHSGGVMAVLYSMQFYLSVKAIPYECLILIEIGMVDLETYLKSQDGRAKLEAVTRGAAERPRDWASKEAARAWFGRRFPWKTWEPRVLDLYTEHGLRPVEPGSTRVTTKCDRKSEARFFSQPQSMFPAVDQIARICSSVPLHAVCGERNDFIFSESRQCMTDIRKGRKMASVTVVPDSGHTLIQQQPVRLAELLWNVITNSTPRSHVYAANTMLARL